MAKSRKSAMSEVAKKIGKQFQKGPVVFDGAMGTALYEQGVLYKNCIDEASVSKPDLVKKVHLSYLQAGAQVLGTNTFGANRTRLTHFGLEGQLTKINEAAVKLALEVAEDKAWVFGCVGPTGKIFQGASANELSTLEDEFAEQVQVLVSAGVQAIVLETFRQTLEIETAVRAVQKAVGGMVPVLASVSFDASGTLSDGTGPEQSAQRLKDLGADFLGVNCCDGPAGVFEMATRMLSAGLPVVAQPNAGLPKRVEGRLAYLATPEYFQIYARRLFKAGIAGVGGCCGTHPEHIRKIASAARMIASGQHGDTDDGGGMRELSTQTTAPAPGIEIVPTNQKGELGAKLGKKFVVSVEINPPGGLNLDKAIEGARLLKAGGVDVINVADGPRASARMGNLALCLEIQRRLEMPALMHVTSRDRNTLGLVAHLLAAHYLGVNNLVVITGDPPKMGDFPDATAVYDTDSIGLLRMIQGFNRGFDPGGKPLGQATSFLCATGAEPAAKDFEKEIHRLEQKVAAGAELIMTQPVYDAEVVEKFLARVKSWNVPILLGLLPLASDRNAEFLHNEVPGMSVPASIRERMKEAGSGENGKQEGVAIAREMLLNFHAQVQGAYIMPPFGRHELALKVIEGLPR